MKYLLIFFLSSWKISTAQTFSYPKLAKQGTKLERLIPQNWKLIDTVYGDLNNDQTADLAFILEYHLPITESRAYGDSETDLIKEFQKPRVLAVYFKNEKSGAYVFAMQNNNFILRSEEGGAMGDPFKAINITDNSLFLTFEGGSNWRWKLNYEFKYNLKDWSLVKANNIYYHAATGEMTDKLYDFSKRTLKQTTGNLFNRSALNEVSEEILYFSQQKTFNTFKKPWTWEITKDNFL